MTCYYCRGEIKDEEPVQVGFGKFLHAACKEAYRDYLKQVVEFMSKRSEVF